MIEGVSTTRMVDNRDKPKTLPREHDMQPCNCGVSGPSLSKRAGLPITRAESLGVLPAMMELQCLKPCLLWIVGPIKAIRDLFLGVSYGVAAVFGAPEPGEAWSLTAPRRLLLGSCVSHRLV